MSKSPIPFPKNWETMSPEERRAYVDKHFFRPIRRNNLLSGIISVVGLMVFLLWLVMVSR